jgi:hypothetical protein
MTTSTTIDAARVELMLTELRLPGIKAIWAGRQLASWLHSPSTRWSTADAVASSGI